MSLIWPTIKIILTKQNANPLVKKHAIAPKFHNKKNTLHNQKNLCSF